jgi:hypothetical protein
MLFCWSSVLICPLPILLAFIPFVFSVA